LLNYRALFHHHAVDFSSQIAIVLPVAMVFHGCL
jgi:hypothetical protein